MEAIKINKNEINVNDIEKFIYALNDEELEEVTKNLTTEEKELIHFMRFCKKIFDSETLYKKAQNMIGGMIYETLISEN